MDRLFIYLQHILPQHLVSRCAGWLADLQRPLWLKNWLIHIFVRHFRVDMSEAANPDHTSYASFNAFFTRPLREDARTLADADIVCPADGAISQLGPVQGGRIFQAKGQSFSAWELLGGDPERAAHFTNGSFATIYLAPRDYHRVHMPLAGRLTATCYIPGKVFSVNQVTAENVPRLFARNERLVCYFDTAAGPMAMVLVGAMIVAGIETVWSGQVTPATSQPVHHDHVATPRTIELAQGEEMGRFKLGSTVILLFGPDAVEFDAAYTAGSVTRLGEALGRFGSAC
ncbi:MAG: archaetidylserine decarboxylase [Halieaceae bacterium]|jgi:phosphatidylserine decarboxylase|nr:archaetidylserine decarboxylase [Halieaceae bacterium]